MPASPARSSPADPIRCASNWQSTGDQAPQQTRRPNWTGRRSTELGIPSTAQCAPLRHGPRRSVPSCQRSSLCALPSSLLAYKPCGCERPLLTLLVPCDTEYAVTIRPFPEGANNSFPILRKRTTFSTHPSTIRDRRRRYRGRAVFRQAYQSLRNRDRPATYVQMGHCWCWRHGRGSHHPRGCERPMRWDDGILRRLQSAMLPRIAMCWHRWTHDLPGLRRRRRVLWGQQPVLLRRLYMHWSGSLDLYGERRIVG